MREGVGVKTLTPFNKRRHNKMSLMILSLSHFFHLLATVVWIGGIAMVVLVILPGAKVALEPAPMVGRFMKEVTKRFTPLANASILVLIVTGVVITYYEKNSIGFFNPWNAAMLLKLSIVISMVVIHFYRGLVLTPRIDRLSGQLSNSKEPSYLSSRIARLQNLSLNLVKVNLLLGLTVLLLTGILSSLQTG